MADNRKRFEMTLGANGTMFTTSSFVPFKTRSEFVSLRCFTMQEVLIEYSNLCILALNNKLEMMMDELIDNRKNIIDSTDEDIQYVVDNRLRVFEHAEFKAIDTALNDLENGNIEAIIVSERSCRIIAKSLMLLSEEQRNANIPEGAKALYEDLVNVLLDTL